MAEEEKASDMAEEEQAGDTARTESDMKEENLAKCFSGVLAFLQDGEGFGKYFGNVLEEECKDLSNHLQDLLQRDCGIVVSGDTSVGKSSLINKFLGQNVLFEDTLEATTKVYRIIHSNVYQVKMHQRGTDQPGVNVFQSIEELRQALADIEKEEKRDESIYQVDVMLPFTNLKGNVTIIDTPGTGDSEELKQIVQEYLPKAVAFVFVLDVTRAGGLQKDRVLQTMKDIFSKLDVMLCFDPQDVIFLRNKWDCVVATEERKMEIKSSTTFKIKKEWPWTVDENIFDTILKECEEQFQYSSEFQRFQAAILRLIRKKENIRFLTHSSFLVETISNAKVFITNRIADVKMSTEEKEVFSKRMTDKIEKFSKDIKKMQDATDANVQKILWNLASDLEAYIHSSEFKEIVVNTEPKLTSFRKTSINREMQKRIENTVVVWAKEKAPEIINREIENFIIKEVNRIYGEIRVIQSKWTGITDQITTESLSLKIAGTVFSGALLSSGGHFWTLFLGLQALIIVTVIGVVTVVARGVIDLLNLTKDAETVVNDCFTTFLQSLNRDRLLERVKKCMIDRLFFIHDKLFKEQLPKELKNLERSLKFSNMDKEKLKHDEKVLKLFLRTVENFEEQLSEINQSVAFRNPDD